jgi:hypothetical protein
MISARHRGGADSRVRPCRAFVSYQVTRFEILMPPGANVSVVDFLV